ncbi:ErfK/YbiS/YcfS/YnhG family protein [Methylobacterium sp. 4-46]|uniref:L,D-transpeptidase n=1 Tax=unclassified Methylobacterium TaxID=2615210 RepID=UPI000152DB35|nr:MULTISPECIES: L,D-transpeptidase [Methylobacterium]ACA17371.1 ErfK/YbiS/YcfS/YnhG family protein [Methylobacterium sp. 4-46]WFT83058.1 L,D-transpeptidase [Methylobacterium nodulans]
MIKQSGWAATIAVAATVACGPATAREIVAFEADVSPGSIVVRTSERRLYFVNGDGTAIRYPIAVGKSGKQWTGLAHVEGKYVQPAWSPPWEVKRDNPRLPNVIAGGSPRNPMGAAALTLDRGEYAIHGTNRPSSIGTFASYGCIRMYNQDVVDLFGRVAVGTPVIVTR